MESLDVLVLGAGPAGCAAAIRARRAGLRVLVVDCHRGPLRSPGETLHPGIESVVAELGVHAGFMSAGFHRHRGVWVSDGGERHFRAYGEDSKGPWLGFQADRAIFHGLLQARVLESGARLLRAQCAESAIVRNGRVCGVRSNGRDFRADFTIDATGRRSWLGEELRSEVEWHSPPLSARFGWSYGPASSTWDGEPTFTLGTRGWSWRAPIQRGREAWAELRIGEPDAPRPQGLDQTWLLRPACAGPGFFLVGDAAASLDPSSSHGVLRALLGGILSAYLIEKCLQHGVPEAAAAEHYRHWNRQRFERESGKLREIYAERFLRADLFGETAVKPRAE